MVEARRKDPEPSSWCLRDTEMESKLRVGQKGQLDLTGSD